MERQIPLDGCLNFRDLGGYATADGRRLRWRRLFRSDGLHGLSESDVRLLCDDVGLSDVIDLRSSMELASEGRGALEREAIDFHHAPLFDGDTVRASGEQPATLTLSDRYFGLVEVAKKPIARVVSILSEAEGAAVYHCAAGKDRTGVISAVLLGLLGVRDEVIVADYALTRDNLDAIVERLQSLEGYREMLEALPPDTMHAEPKTMIELLGRIRERYGSMRGYAESAGIDDTTLDRLAAASLEGG